MVDKLSARTLDYSLGVEGTLRDMFGRVLLYAPAPSSPPATLDPSAVPVPPESLESLVEALPLRPGGDILTQDQWHRYERECRLAMCGGWEPTIIPVGPNVVLKMLDHYQPHAKKWCDDCAGVINNTRGNFGSKSSDSS